MTSRVTACRACSDPLTTVVSLGLLPLANQYVSATSPEPLTFYPHDLVRCTECGLAQLGITAASQEVFPASYPYSSSTTRALRENFADLARESSALLDLRPEDLAIDIGGNDGNLLSNFVGKQRVLNVTPEDIGKLGEERGIPHIQEYWTVKLADDLRRTLGTAKLITATNVFAHMPSVHDFVLGVTTALANDGVFLIEVQYIGDLLKGAQFDHLYLEHQMFWGLDPLRALLKKHDLVIPFARTIDSHGGSIRVYACRPEAAPAIAEKAQAFRARAIYEDTIEPRDFDVFAKRVAESKVKLWGLLSSIRAMGGRIFGIGAPSRASTLINYCGIDHNILDCICEVPGSYKIGKLMPGTQIEVVDEERLYREQPEFALLLNHHLANEMIGNVRAKGYRGKFVTPLPEAKVIQ